MENQNGENLQPQNELVKKSDADSSDSTGPISPSAKAESNQGSSEPIPTSSSSSVEHHASPALQEALLKDGFSAAEAASGEIDREADSEKLIEQDLQQQKAERELADLNPHLAAPPSLPHQEPKKPVAGGPTQPSRDEDKLDSLGNEKSDVGPIGPRGAHVSPEHLTEEEKAESEKKRQEREHRGMSSTAAIDSAGNSKDIFRHEPQGHDKHGMRIPDKNTGELVEEAPKHVGPRGMGVPKDTYHRS